MSKTFWGFVIGAALTALLFAYVWKKTSADKREERNDTYILTNQISRMNKMVVMEQNLTSLQKTKISNEVLGGLLPGADKQIVTFTRTNAQVSYDLNKMRIEVDLSLIHISEPTRPLYISYAVFCLKKKIIFFYFFFFFFNKAKPTKIYTSLFVGSVRCV